MAYKWERVVFGMVVFFCGASSPSMAYYETHPPYQFKQGSFKHAPDNPLAEKDIPAFITKNIDPAYLKPQVYKIDVDGNGTQDYIAFVWPGAGTLLNEIHIYLKRFMGGYQAISFVEDAGSGIEDVVDINKDGKWEVILTDLYTGENHNYFSYSVYEFKNYRLVNADKKFTGFPKFVWFSNKNNDKDTKDITAKDRKAHVQRKNAEISYETIP